MAEKFKMTDCASCGAPLEPRDGPGRPATYCSEGCRRVIEYRIRALVRRIDKHELTLRELKARDLGDFPFFEDGDRRRLAALTRRWLAEDRALLRELLGAPAPADKP